MLRSLYFKYTAFINNCILHLSLLHRIFPDRHSSDICVVCSSASDTLDHFLFRCPNKALVWQGIIFEFLWPTVTILRISAIIPSFLLTFTTSSIVKSPGQPLIS
ncbi:hypothetical protein BD408DRAFT_255025 [Parasitella parasitica]|nr:hypothetical protein BD408DRAFT_255025 [Parasitella parasitica]